MTLTFGTFKLKPWSLVAAALAWSHLPLAHAEDTRITFSGLNNSINDDAEPDLAQAVIPSTYQPLHAGYPASSTDKAIADGGKLGVTITWANAGTANPTANPAVTDHTGDAGKAGAGLGGGVMWGQGSYAMSFDPAVEIPSFFWSYFDPSGSEPQVGTISAFVKADDAAPAKTITVTYHAATGYVWAEEKGFAGLTISKLAFEPGTAGAHALNIDDITVALPKSKK